MNIEQVEAMDLQDPLAAHREAFAMPEGLVYLDGNSLGALPKAAPARAKQVIESEWGTDLISSWNKHAWINLPEQVGEKIAPIIGAAAGQVICCDSTSINLFKVISAALSLRPDRKVILSQRDNFPTDLYVAEGIQSFLGSGACQLELLEGSQLTERLADDVAVVLLTDINFRTGERHDISEITRAAHACGALVIWDLAHSAGVLPLTLDQDRVDFAVGCGYKYLNGGPGAPAFLYAAKRHVRNPAMQHALTGWMGHTAPFEFSEHYENHPSIKQFLTGTPQIISMAVLDAALNVFANTDLVQVRQKSIDLTSLFITLVKNKPGLDEFTLESPVDPEARGSQLSYSHNHAWEISQALNDAGVIVDFREPNIIRFGFSPLYIRFLDVWKSVQIFDQIMQNKSYQDSKYQQRKSVT